MTKGTERGSRDSRMGILIVELTLKEELMAEEFTSGRHANSMMGNGLMV